MVSSPNRLTEHRTTAPNPSKVYLKKKKKKKKKRPNEKGLKKPRKLWVVEFEISRL